MRIQGLVVMTVAMGMSAWAGHLATARDRSVAVCLEAGTEASASAMAVPAVSKIYAEVGVGIEWTRNMRSCAEKDNAIVVTLSFETPETLKPGALAYALPYEGTHIVVFYDRVKTVGCNRSAQGLLAYVLVHEIAHILQGVSRHSDSGIMKARWDSGDFFDMEKDRLKFASTDIFLIHLGMDRRANHPAVLQ